MCCAMNDRHWGTGGGSLRSVSGIDRAPLSGLLSAIMTCPPSSPPPGDPPLPGVDHIRYNYYVVRGPRPGSIYRLLHVLRNVRIIPGISYRHIIWGNNLI